MSINSINIFRIVIYVISAIILSGSIISAIVKLCKAKKILIETLLVILFLSIGILVAFTSICDVYKFTIDENTESVITNISSNSIDYDKFEPIYTVTDKRIATIENGDTLLYCTIQPKNTYTNTVEEDFYTIYEGYSFLNDIQEKLYTRKINSNFGDIIVSPVCCERIYDYLVVCFKGYIVIPIDEKTELFIEYECDSTIKDCRDFICDSIENIKKTADGSPS